MGDDGAGDLQHTAEVKFLGDDATIHEMVKDLLNDKIVIWLKDSDCLTNDSYIQLGDDCNPLTVKVDFDGKNTGNEGGKKLMMNRNCFEKRTHLVVAPGWVLFGGSKMH